jgi:OmpA-OmpF porin, OOP family
MKPVNWVVLVAVVIAIAIGWMFWNRGEKPADNVVAQQSPPPAQPSAPATPKVEPFLVAVLFDFNQAALRSSEKPKLDEAANKFKSGAYGRVEAVGHADRIGSDQYNMDLSQQRAKVVSDYLAGKGVDGGSIHTAAKGKAEPVTGDACSKMGKDRANNRKLVQCLQPDRRVGITLAAK